MINLLPIIEKKKLTVEYRRRLATVFLVVFGVLFVCAVIPLVVSLRMVAYNISYINNISGALKEGSTFKETEAKAKIVKDINRKIAILNEPLGTTMRANIMGVFSDIFSAAEEGSVGGIKQINITYLSYEQGQKKTVTLQTLAQASTTDSQKESGLHKITLRGKAKTRQAYLLFVRSLETNKNFVSIDAPVSNLVNSENIDFALSIVLRDKAV